RLDGAALSFELNFSDGLVRHPHFVKPGSHGVFIGSFHDTHGFAFCQIGKAAITLDVRVLLGGLCELPKLVSSKLAGRDGVSAHELCHDVFPFCLVVYVTDEGVSDSQPTSSLVSCMVL